MILVYLGSICLEIVIYSTSKLVSLHHLCFFFFFRWLNFPLLFPFQKSAMQLRSNRKLGFPLTEANPLG